MSIHLLACLCPLVFVYCSQFNHYFMHHLEQELDRYQISMMALEEMVAQDSYAKLVDRFVDSLPFEDLGFQHASHEKEDRPPYHPDAQQQ